MTIKDRDVYLANATYQLNSSRSHEYSPVIRALYLAYSMNPSLDPGIAKAGALDLLKAYRDRWDEKALQAADAKPWEVMDSILNLAGIAGPYGGVIGTVGKEYLKIMRQGADEFLAPGQALRAHANLIFDTASFAEYKKHHSGRSIRFG